jgi:DNA polymerase-3 subunit gamma/tau
MNEDKRVLALKYRPKTFEDLIGQSTISQTLSMALDNDRLSHAYLFSGLRGSGKTSTARIMARALLCEKGPTSRPCGKCSHCLSTIENRHLDVIEMDAASNRGIDDIKELIEHTKYKPSSAKYKIFIIDEVHMLTTQAFNALLKTLEEPPLFVKFILATTDPLKLPATILSRTQHFRFKKIANKEIVSHLEHILNLEKVSFEINALEILARSGNGSLRDTLTLLDQAIIYSKHHVTSVAVTSMLGLIDPRVMDELFNQIMKKCPVGPLVELFGDYESGALIDEMSIYLKTKLLENDTRISMILYDRFFKILGESKYLLGLNSDNEFVLALTFMKLIEATQLKSIDELIEEIASGEVCYPQNLQKNKLKLENNMPAQQVQTGSKSLFEQLKEKIFDYSYDVGKCFEENIEFISFESNTLRWVSYAEGENINILRKAFPRIKQLIHEIFGDLTAIDFQKGEKKNEQLSHAGTIEKEQIIESEPSSMIEEVEFGGSCIQNNCIEKIASGSKEVQINEILESKMIGTIKEIFRPSTIIVRSKN